jgi:hypothetical protein
VVALFASLCSPLLSHARALAVSGSVSGITVVLRVPVSRLALITFTLIATSLAPVSIITRFQSAAICKFITHRCHSSILYWVVLILLA